MDPEFWQKKWRENKIAFHENEGNALLSQAFHLLSLEKGNCVLVPLCGKSNDIGWLAAQGCRVVGIELDQSAVEAFFAENELKVDLSSVGELKCYKSGSIELFVGDFFALTNEILGPVDAIYDRAALVAMPEAMRASYARHLAEISRSAPQLLITYDYDQSQTDGPPFSVPDDKIGQVYEGIYDHKLVASAEISGPLAERCSGTENAWLLRPNPTEAMS